jgi:hypothetical protein
MKCTDEEMKEEEGLGNQLETVERGLEPRQFDPGTPVLTGYTG